MYLILQDDPQSQFLLEIIKNDKLRQWEKEQQDEAEKSILIAAKMMSSIIEDNYTAGTNNMIYKVINNMIVRILYNHD